MELELEEEFNQFLYNMEEVENALVFAQYFDEDDYEDEFGKNEICEYQMKFVEKVREWLSINKPGKYIVTFGWCVFIMTPDEARKRRMSEKTIENGLVK